MRPAWYVPSGGAGRDWVAILHLPYTAWHLSYVVAGGCLATSVAWDRLALTVTAFFLAMGVAAHALDELHGRPLRTRIPGAVLAALAVAALAGACAIGVLVAIDHTLWLLAFVASGAAIVPLYNLELLGGRFHTDLWFALSWGAFPVVTAYVAMTGVVRAEAIVGAVAATALSLAQRRLSSAAREIRRSVARVEGALVLGDGRRRPLSEEMLVAAPEAALRLLTLATVLAAAALVVARLSA